MSISENVKAFQSNSSDTGSSSVQIALMTERINNLTEHFKTHKERSAFQTWTSEDNPTKTEASLTSSRRITRLITH